MSIQCPVCSGVLPDEQTTCSQCGIDLTHYLSVYYAPDILYNEAVKLIEQGEYRSAYDSLAAAHYMRPHDTEIIAHMAICAENTGDILGAMEKLAVAMAEMDDPALMQEYMRLNGILEKDQKTEAADRERMDRMFDIVKGIIADATREAIGEMLLTSSKQSAKDGGAE